MKNNTFYRISTVVTLLILGLTQIKLAKAQIIVGSDTNISALDFAEMLPGKMKGSGGWPPPMNDREWVVRSENGVSFIEIPSHGEIADLNNSLSPYVSYDLVFEAPGTYYYHMLFNCSEGNGSDDSCFPVWDWDGETTPTYNWNLGQGKTEWTWRMRTASITTTEANEAHRLTIFAREDGLQISMFAFRDKNWGFNEDFIPTKAPQNLTSTKTENGFELSWDLAEIIDQIDEPEDITYHVVVNGEEAHAATEITSYEFTEVVEGQNYEAYIFTTDLKDNQSENSATVIALDGEAPTSPANLLVTVTTESALTVTWESSTDNVAVTGYGVMIGDEAAVALDENALTYTFENLEEYTQYTVKVYAMDAAGNTSADSEVEGMTLDVTAPEFMPNLASSEIGEETFKVRWDAATDAGSGVAGYEVQLGEETPMEVTADVTDYTFINLNPYTNYSVRILAKDEAGNKTDFSDALEVMTTDVTAPTAPGNLSVTETTGTTVTVTWESSTDNVAVTGYGVMIGDEAAVALDENALTYTFENLEEYTQYTVKVYAMDAAGNTSSDSEVEGMTLDVTAPEFMPNLASSEIGEETFKVSWDAATDAGSGVAGYEVQLGEETPMEVAADVTDYTFTELNPYTNYSVRILAKDAGGNKTDFSDALEVMTTDETNPSPVTDLAVADVSGAHFTVSWTAATDNDQVAHYEYKLMQADEIVLEETTTELLLVLDNLQGMTTYDFSVWAVDRAGNMSEVVTTQATTLDDEAPSVPTALVASEITETGFKLDWDAADDNVAVTAYRVKIDEEEPIEVANNTAMIDGRMPLTEYSVSVAAGDASGNWSAYSEQVSVSTIDITPPSSPTALVVSDVTPFSAQLAWEASTDNVAVAHYEVYVNDEKAGETATLTYALDGLSRETSYSVSVKAVDDSGNVSEPVATTFETTRPLSNEGSEDKIKVFPNPALGEMNIQLNIAEQVNFVIHNMAGQKISDGIIRNGNLKLRLPAGMYVLHINTKAKKHARVIIFQ